MSDRIAESIGSAIGDLLVDMAKVDRAPKQENAKMQDFGPPQANKAGVYFIRDSNRGQAHRKKIYIDGERVGYTSPKVYLYKEVTSGEHVLSTNSVFGKNSITINAMPGELYFVRQSLKFGIIFRRTALQLISTEEGKKAVFKCELVL